MEHSDQHPNYRTGIRIACFAWRTRHYERWLPVTWSYYRFITKQDEDNLHKDVASDSVTLSYNTSNWDDNGLCKRGFWPDTMLKCCFFHLTQNIWRKVQDEGMQAEDNLRGDLAICIRLLPAFAFAPPSHVLAHFTEVAVQFPMPQASGLLLYFEDTYIGRLLPGGTYLESLFPITLWHTLVYLEQPTPWRHGIAPLIQPLAVIIPICGNVLLPWSGSRDCRRTTSQLYCRNRTTQA